MWWWVAAVVTWLISFGWIAFTMAEVIRGKWSNKAAFPAYLFHGFTAVLVLVFVMNALAV